MRVPKVSLRDASPEAFAAAARGGCFVLTDHDVPQGLMADLRREMLTVRTPGFIPLPLEGLDAKFNMVLLNSEKRSIDSEGF